MLDDKKYAIMCHYEDGSSDLDGNRGGGKARAFSRPEADAYTFAWTLMFAGRPAHGGGRFTSFEVVDAPPDSISFGSRGQYVSSPPIDIAALAFALFASDPDVDVFVTDRSERRPEQYESTLSKAWELNALGQRTICEARAKRVAARLAMKAAK